MHRKVANTINLEREHSNIAHRRMLSLYCACTLYKEKVYKNWVLEMISNTGWQIYQVAQLYDPTYIHLHNIREICSNYHDCYFGHSRQHNRYDDFFFSDFVFASSHTQKKINLRSKNSHQHIYEFILWGWA